MPTSLAGNPLAFLRGAGGNVAPPGGMSGAPTGPAPSLSGIGLLGMQGENAPTPGLSGLAGAAAILPQVLAQQQREYYRRFLLSVGKLLREFMRSRGIGPRTVSTIGRAVTAIDAASNTLMKERPEEAEPVNSIMAQSMMARQAMAQTPPLSSGPMSTLPVMR
jgi:hypothetical protein